jgi:hypothetical protein
MYSHMNSKGIHAILHSLGLFVGSDYDCGAEAPYALATTYAGMTLFSQKGELLLLPSEYLSHIGIAVLIMTAEHPLFLL